MNIAVSLPFLSQKLIPPWEKISSVNSILLALVNMLMILLLKDFVCVGGEGIAQW
jgi:hypothetical protein